MDSLDKELDNLLDIKDVKKKRDDLVSKYKKVAYNEEDKTQVELEKGLYDLLCGNTAGMNGSLSSIAENFYIYMDNFYTPTILNYCKEDNTYRILNENHVASYLYHSYNEYSRQNNTESENYTSISSCKKSVETWMYQYNKSYNKKIVNEFPKQTRFKSDTEPCFKRLSYDPVLSDDIFLTAPIFQGMLSRMGNSEAFVKIIGGMLEEKSNRKQSIWLWGPTDGGKSIIQKLVMKLMGGINNAAVLSPDDFKGNHWKEPLVGKQLWLVNEASIKFVNTSAYKNLTGDGTHQINPKGRAAYMADLKGHFLFSSNERPLVKNDDAIINRIVPCFISPVPTKERIEDSELWEKLELEIPYIMGYCVKKYKDNGKRPVEYDKKSLLEAIESEEWDLQATFDRFFEVDEKADEKNCTVTCIKFIQLLDPVGGMHSRTVKMMKDFVEKKYNCIVGLQKKVGGRNLKYITGIRELTHTERQDLL